MLSKFVSSNTASSSGSGTLPSNTITNPKEDLKGITTQSGVAYKGPIISTPSKVVKQGTEVTKDQGQTPSSQSTAPVQPSVIQSETQTSISEPVVAPVSVSMPNLKLSIPYPSRRDNKRHRDQANEQIEKFYEIFKDLSFEISFTDALILMPKFASTLKALIGNKKKLTDYVVVDFEPDPRVPLILGRCFLKTDRALIDVHKGELTLCIGNEAINYNLDQTVRYSANCNQMTANKIDIICEVYSQEVLSFFDVTASGNPTPYDDPIVSTTSPTLTPFGDSNFLLFEEADAFLVNHCLLPNHEQYFPSFKKELKVCKAKTVKSSVNEPPEVELKDLPPHLESSLGNYLTYRVSTRNFVLTRNLWKDYKPAVQHQRRVNPKIHDIIKKEVEKLLDVGLIYPISDSRWLSPVHCVPKKGDFTVVEHEENELIPTRLVIEWRVCINYQKLNEATRKYHFPLLFMDQMLEILARNEFYCFLDGFSGYFQIPIDSRDQEKTTFTCPHSVYVGYFP
nr:reverse transcriptase domain-containing protein [Tanacetum cinerariifolium]